jgi:16S rRNA C967 or C1407 C5-methylase (RsmB/RsmF family)
MPVKINEKLLRRLSRELFQDETEREIFVQTIQSGIVEHSAIVCLDKSADLQLQSEYVIESEWLPSWVKVVSAEHTFGSSEFHTDGKIYCMDLSSVFVGAALCSAELRSFLPASPRVLDLCSSPGGKAVFASRALQPAFLCCNEIIGKRHPALLSNVKRCQIPNAVVTSHDPQYFAEALANMFHLVIVDAPCSGQSLVLKGIKAEGAFHEVTQKRNAMRQRRILGNAAQAVLPGGLLLYSTCTFGATENEDNLTWFLKKNPDFELQALESFSKHRSELIPQPCYRFWPHRDSGAGAFFAVLRKRSSSCDDFPLFEILEKLHTRWSSMSKALL